MDELNTNILTAPQYRPMGAMEIAERGQRLGDMMQNRDIQAQQENRQQQEYTDKNVNDNIAKQREEKARAIFQTSQNDKGEFDHKIAINRLYQSGFPDYAQKMEAQVAVNDEKNAMTEWYKNRHEAGFATAEKAKSVNGANILNDWVTKYKDDPTNPNAQLEYESAVVPLIRTTGIGADRMPDKYDETVLSKAQLLAASGYDHAKQMDDIINKQKVDNLATIASEKQFLDEKKLAYQMKKDTGLSLVTGKDGTRNININGLNEDENDAINRAVTQGRLDPYKLNSKTAKIYAAIEMKSPGTKFNELGAQSVYMRNSGTMNTKTLLNSIDPVLDNLSKAGETLNNTPIPGINKVVNFIKEESGNPDIVAFNNARDDAIAETERGLLGTGVLSDSKYLRAVKNVRSAQSPDQLYAAITQMKFAIKTRLEAVNAGPNPNATANPANGAPPVTRKPLGSIFGNGGK